MRLPRILRLWLVLLALVFAQAAMLAHAVEHLDADEEATHSCTVCLAGQNLETPGPLPVAALLAEVGVPTRGAVAETTPDQYGGFLPLPPARAPPLT